MFGRQIEGKGRYWGARAIYERPLVGNRLVYQISILFDRQHVEPAKENDPDERGRKDFIRWVNKKALPWLRKAVKKEHLCTDEDRVLRWQDGNRVIEACPNRSYGYLYIGCRELE
jgi:hypothetical protein